MRIAYLHQYFNTPAMPGGTRSYEMARRLVRMGHDVHMVTTWREGGKSGGWFETEEAGIHVHWIPLAYSNRLSYRRRLAAFGSFAWSAGRKAASLGCDLVFATSTPLTIAIPGAHAARKGRVPMVLEVRDLWPEVPEAMGALRHRPAIAAARWLERYAYRHSARVVALSPGMRDGVIRAGYPPERVSVIPNACDVELFDVGAAPGRALRDSLPWLGDRPLVVYTGTLGMVNGVGYLVSVAAAVAARGVDVCFAVIGDGRETEQVRRAAAEQGVLDRSFFMLPAVAKSEIPAWLSAADLATSVVIPVPALWGNSANKVFDALAAGRPVAINHEGWLADLLRETGAGLVLDPADHGRAADQLAGALRDAEWRARAGAAARELARDRFNRDRLAGELEATLQAAARDGMREPSAGRKARPRPLERATP